MNYKWQTPRNLKDSLSSISRRHQLCIHSGFQKSMQVLPGWIPVFYLGTVEPWSCGPPDFLFVRSISLSTFKHSRLCAITLIKRQRAFWQMSIWSTVQNFHPLQLRWLLNSFDTWRVEATDDTTLQHAYYPAMLHSKTWSMTIGASGLSVFTFSLLF